MPWCAGAHGSSSCAKTNWASKKSSSASPAARRSETLHLINWDAPARAAQALRLAWQDDAVKSVGRPRRIRDGLDAVGGPGHHIDEPCPGSGGQPVGELHGVSPVRDGGQLDDRQPGGDGLLYPQEAVRVAGVGAGQILG